MSQHRAHILLALHCRKCCMARFFCPFCTQAMEFHADKKLGAKLEHDQTLHHTCVSCGAQLTATTRGFVDNSAEDPRALSSSSGGMVYSLEEALALPPAVKPPRRRLWPFR